MRWLRRHYLKLLVALAITLAAVAFAYFGLCPFCGGILMPLRTLSSTGKIKQSRNLALWNGSMDDDSIKDYSVVCTRCWMAYHPYWKRWERASEFPDSFQRPLTPAIRHVPLPAEEHIHYRVVYYQFVTRSHVAEMVVFWCDELPEIIGSLRNYAAGEHLVWRTSGGSTEPGQICVHIQTEPDI